MSDLTIFNEQIRRIDHEGEIFYAVVDVVEVLTESPNPSDYWYRLKQRDLELSTICRKFPVKHKTNNRTYQTECANREGLLRIIQSVPSPNAEPFKRWLAMTGNRRLSEIAADPIEAEKERLRLAGIDEREIKLRIDAMITNGQLIAEWDGRGINAAGQDALADEIHKGTFEGMTRADHADLKRLEDRDILTDHMTRLEIAFSNLGDASTLEEIAEHDHQSFEENEAAAMRGKDGRESSNRIREGNRPKGDNRSISDRWEKAIERQHGLGARQIGLRLGSDTVGEFCRIDLSDEKQPAYSSWVRD